jgi:protein SCO1/2
MMPRAMLAVLLLLLGGQALAGINTAVLDKVYVDPTPGATLPLHLNFRDDAGRPLSLADAIDNHATVLIFADYTCRTLCGPILDFTTTALQQSELKSGSDYRLVVVGLDPKDRLADAQAIKASRLDNGGPIARSAVFLTGSESTIAQATAALGYHFTYDTEHDQYAHPAAAFVLTGTGKVTRVLSGLGLSGADLRLALVDASQGQVGTLADRFRLLCYGYDPTRGIYTARIGRVLAISGAITLIAMAAGVLVMHRMTKAVS